MNVYKCTKCGDRVVAPSKEPKFIAYCQNCGEKKEHTRITNHGVPESELKLAASIREGKTTLPLPVEPPPEKPKSNMA